MITPALGVLAPAILDRWPGAVSWGVYNRRYIAGTRIWSQHAWGNAIDVSNFGGIAAELYPRFAYLDRVYEWLKAKRDELPIGTVLWRVPAHFDHIHVEGLPKQYGSPPASGTVAVMLDVIAELGSSGPWVARIQADLNRARNRNAGARWPILVVDGRYGPLTAEAVAGYQTAAGIAGTAGVVAGVLDSRTAITLTRETDAG